MFKDIKEACYMWAAVCRKTWFYYTDYWDFRDCISNLSVLAGKSERRNEKGKKQTKKRNEQQQQDLKGEKTSKILC